MFLYNSISKKVEQFISIKENEVMMYFCGPTTYNYAHIGNARPAVIADLLVNVLQASGYSVKYASNYTDIDDRIIQKAIDMKKDALEVSSHYIEIYQKDLASLHVKKPMFTPKVSDYIPQIVQLIQQLIDKKCAYVVNGDVYFSIDSIQKYAEISHQKKEELVVGARIEENYIKKNPLDFVLWKKTDVGKNWETQFSNGRPGWHSECVVMINEVFQTSLIDIHGGGSDLKFPHHDNEVAHACALHNTTLANYWIHNGMIKVDGAKMSKSLGNVFYIKDLVEKYGGNEMRWFILSAPYRSELMLTENTLQTAVNEFNKVRQVHKQLKLKLRLNKIEKSLKLDNAYSECLTQLQNDLNVAKATTVLFDFIKVINQSLRTKQLDFELLSSYENTLDAMLQLFGYVLEDIQLSDEDKVLFEKWEQAKAMKNFEEADIYRNKLIQKGLV